MIKSFAPSVDKNTEIMIIGSMPGEASLNAGQYYAYKYNLFWPMMTAFFSSAKNSPESYPQKLQMLLNNKIGLWDTLASCERKGSADGSIKTEKPNNFPMMLTKYPKIKTLLFNGQAAHKYFLKHFGQIEGINYLLLPSTSPAAAAISKKQKAALWKAALNLNNIKTN